MLYFVLRAMGELLLSNLEYKSFADFAGDILGLGGLLPRLDPRAAVSAPPSR